MLENLSQSNAYLQNKSANNYCYQNSVTDYSIYGALSSIQYYYYTAAENRVQYFTSM